MKFLGKLAELLDLKEDFEKFRIEHSMVLNNAKQHGKLCLSIHPLDYMTMSDNDGGWTSCMSWQEGGCYRQGTVEMMNSPMVVVTYLCASEDMYIDVDKTWNSKKWRELFIINEHVITPVKPYPYHDEKMTEECLTWLNELSGKIYSDDNFLFENGDNRYLNYYRLNATTRKMYNDFASCQHLTKIKLPVPEKREGKIIRWSFNYSGKSECMWCGSTDSDYIEESSLLCDNCSDNNQYKRCCCCNERIDLEYDDYFCNNDGEYYCSSCRDEYYTYDEINEEWISREDAVEIYLASSRNPEANAHNLYTTHNSALFTHEYILSDKDENGEFIVHRNKEGEYYIYIDQAPFKFLNAIFGNGAEICLNRLRDYITDKESYRGYECIDIAHANYWDFTSRRRKVKIIPE